VKKVVLLGLDKKDSKRLGKVLAKVYLLVMAKVYLLVK